MAQYLAPAAQLRAASHPLAHSLALKHSWSKHLYHSTHQPLSLLCCSAEFAEYNSYVWQRSPVFLLERSWKGFLRFWCCFSWNLVNIVGFDSLATTEEGSGGDGFAIASAADQVASRWRRVCFPARRHPPGEVPYLTLCFSFGLVTEPGSGF